MSVVASKHIAPPSIGLDRTLSWMNRLSFLAATIQAVCRKEAPNFSEVNEAMKSLFNTSSDSNLYIYLIDEISMLPVVPNHQVDSKDADRPNYPIVIKLGSKDMQLLPKLLPIFQLTLRAIADARGAVGVLRSLGYPDTVIPQALCEEAVCIIGSLSSAVAMTNFAVLAYFLHRDLPVDAAIDYTKLFNDETGEDSGSGTASASTSRSSKQNVNLKVHSSAHGMINESTWSAIVQDTVQGLNSFWLEHDKERDFAGLQVLTLAEGYECWTSRKHADVILSQGFREAIVREKVTLLGHGAMLSTGPPQRVQSAAPSNSNSTNIKGTADRVTANGRSHKEGRRNTIASFLPLDMLPMKVIPQQQQQQQPESATGSNSTTNSDRQLLNIIRRRSGSEPANPRPMSPNMTSVTSMPMLPLATARESGTRFTIDTNYTDSTRQNESTAVNGVSGDEGGVPCTPPRTTTATTAPRGSAVVPLNDDGSSSSSNNGTSSGAGVSSGAPAEAPVKSMFSLSGSFKIHPLPNSPSTLLNNVADALNRKGSNDSINDGSGSGSARSSDNNVSYAPNTITTTPVQRQYHAAAAASSFPSAGTHHGTKGYDESRLSAVGEDDNEDAKTPESERSKGRLKQQQQRRRKKANKGKKGGGAEVNSRADKGTTSYKDSSSLVGGDGSSNSSSSSSAGAVNDDGMGGPRDKAIFEDSDDIDIDDDDDDDDSSDSSDSDSDEDWCDFTKGDLRQMLDNQTTLLRLCITDLKRSGQRSHQDAMHVMKGIRYDVSKLSTVIAAMPSLSLSASDSSSYAVRSLLGGGAPSSKNDPPGLGTTAEATGAVGAGAVGGRSNRESVSSAKTASGGRKSASSTYTGFGLQADSNSTSISRSQSSDPTKTRARAMSGSRSAGAALAQARNTLKLSVGMGNVDMLTERPYSTGDLAVPIPDSEQNWLQDTVDDSAAAAGGSNRSTNTQTNSRQSPSLSATVQRLGQPTQRANNVIYGKGSSIRNFSFVGGNTGISNHSNGVLGIGGNSVSEAQQRVPTMLHATRRTENDKSCNLM